MSFVKSFLKKQLVAPVVLKKAVVPVLNNPAFGKYGLTPVTIRFAILPGEETLGGAVFFRSVVFHLQSHLREEFKRLQ
ncbi:hypothetical protein SDC9_191242 [bioreactor metagenome]|uniref:Uncharacterized protein n=1 Tax=bioreactor metagenome TaxID=1076179 RepID=A0A645HYX0_9ZZZZ